MSLLDDGDAAAASRCCSGISWPADRAIPATAWHDAVVAVGRTVRAQSYFLAYGDTFFLMGAALLLAVAATLLMRRPTGGAGAAAH